MQITLRDRPPVAVNSRTAIAARSSIVPSRGITTRTGSAALPPTTCSISAGLRRMMTKRRPSLPIASKSTSLFGPQETNGDVGWSRYAGSRTSDFFCVILRTCFRPCTPARAKPVNITPWPMKSANSSRSSPASAFTPFAIRRAPACSVIASVASPRVDPTAVAVATAAVRAWTARAVPSSAFLTALSRWLSAWYLRARRIRRTSVPPAISVPMPRSSSRVVRGLRLRCRRSWATRSLTVTRPPARPATDSSLSSDQAIPLTRLSSLCERVATSPSLPPTDVTPAATNRARGPGRLPGRPEATLETVAQVVVPSA